MGQDRVHPFDRDIGKTTLEGASMAILGVCAAVVKNGRILMVKREDFEIWSLPGGHVENGESLAQAAVREVCEETGLEIELTRLVGMYSRSAGWDNGGSHTAVFAARPLSGGLNPQRDEVLDARYFDPAELPDPLFWGHRQRITDALNGVGGSVARWHQMSWPFEKGLKREDIYRIRDQSGLPRLAFFKKHFGQPGSEDDRLEVGGEQRYGNAR